MGNIINRVFESAGPDGKVRGTPQQIIDKYQALARDAQVAGDRVAAESYLQFSEHYSRLLGEAQRQQQESRANAERDDSNAQRTGDDGYDGRREQQNGHQPSRTGQGPSGLTTIDTEDSDDFSGPIETPEERRAHQSDRPTSRNQPESSVVSSSGIDEAPTSQPGSGLSEEVPAEAEPKPRRTRRRTTKPAAEAEPEAVVQAE